MKSPSGIVWCPHCARPHKLTDRICVKTGKALDRGLHRAEVPPHPLVGTMIDGKYRVDRVLGQGGVGTVFAGENVFLRREVAIKVVKDSTHGDAIERLRLEAQIIASLQHPNICDIQDFGVLPHYGPYLVNQRLHGETIAERFKWRRSFRMNDAIEIVAQILSGLQAAHARGIVHRDIKPQNIFLVDRIGCAPLAKILDFGLAKDLNANAARRLTRPGKALGTPQYMAPEQMRGENVSPQSDLFSVGMLVYEMLTGRHPFEAPSIMEMQMRILRSAPSPMVSLSRDIPPSLVSVVLRALEKEQARRHPDAYAMQQELLRAASDVVEDETDPSSSSASSRS